MQYWGHTYPEQLFVLYLKFLFNRVSSVLSGQTVITTTGARVTAWGASLWSSVEEGLPGGTVVVAELLPEKGLQSTRTLGRNTVIPPSNLTTGELGDALHSASERGKWRSLCN